MARKCAHNICIGSILVLYWFYNGFMTVLYRFSYRFYRVFWSFLVKLLEHILYVKIKRKCYARSYKQILNGTWNIGNNGFFLQNMMNRYRRLLFPEINSILRLLIFVCVENCKTKVGDTEIISNEETALQLIINRSIIV